MKKIYLVIAGAFLILLVITSILLSLQKKQTVTETKVDVPFPTSVPRLENTVLPNATPYPKPGVPEIKTVETSDFKAAYVSELNKIVVEKKTPQAEELFYQWINQNQLTEVADNKNAILFTDKKIIPTPGDSIRQAENQIMNFFRLIDDLNNIGRGINSSRSTVNNQASNSSQNTNSNSAPINSGQKIYYAQCGEQGGIPLPDGGNLCSAGCGPTTVAMISSSYIGKQYDPKAIVNLYDSNNYLLGNSGSRYSDAHELLKSLGLKTTDYLIFNSEKSDTVVPQLRKYLSAGWTFFTLASFCEKGCGHYFWITDIDSQGNIIAYDPAYGRYQIPYNENSRYPYPLYRLAFGVKK
jgi:hypothetical protein